MAGQLLSKATRGCLTQRSLTSYCCWADLKGTLWSTLYRTPCCESAGTWATALVSPLSAALEADATLSPREPDSGGDAETGKLPFYFTSLTLAARNRVFSLLIISWTLFPNKRSWDQVDWENLVATSSSFYSNGLELKVSFKCVFWSWS